MKAVNESFDLYVSNKSLRAQIIVGLDEPTELKANLQSSSRPFMRQEQSKASYGNVLTSVDIIST